MIENIGGRRARVLASVISICTVAALVLAHPAGAEPPVPAVPDSGARPPAAAAGAGGGASNQNVPAGLSAGTQQFQAESFAVQALAEQLKKLDAEVELAKADLLARQNEAQAADRRLAELRAEATSAAAEAYKASRELGPFGEYAGDVHRFSKVTPAIGSRAGGESAARELARAEAIARTAADALRAARDGEAAVTARRNTMKTSYDQRAAALAATAADPAAQAAREAELEAYEQAAGAAYHLGAGPNGWAPNPKVAIVLDHAKKQLGKPYVFGAEGPGAYDCSGLVWDSYRQPGVGVRLPRIANEQYRATKKINQADLLPGDLVFFGPPGSWLGIHHVGIYIGGGKMIQAPTTGQVVKISTVWWSRFYGATRVLEAVPVSPNPPPPPASSSSSSSKSPSPSSSSTSPSPSASSSRSPSPTPNPSNNPGSSSTKPSTSPSSAKPSSARPASTSPSPSTGSGSSGP